MTSEELAREINTVCVEAQRRVMLQGDAEYTFTIPLLKSGEKQQRFEWETLEDNLTGLEEELLDTINWAAMAVLKLRERRLHEEENSYPAR